MSSPSSSLGVYGGDTGARALRPSISLEKRETSISPPRNISTKEDSSVGTVEFEEDDDFGTLGGFVHKHLGRLPIQGDRFTAEGVQVEIISVERHRVRKMRLTKLAEPVVDEVSSGRRLGWSSREAEKQTDDDATGEES